MPKREPLPRPADGELEILQVLWELGPSAVRQIQEVLDRRKRTGRLLSMNCETVANGSLPRSTARLESRCVSGIRKCATIILPLQGV